MEKSAAIFTGRSAESDLLNQINLASGLAVGYLLEAQAKDGFWYDYRLPVGVSDEWVTGFVGRSLGEWVPCHKALNAASDAILNQRVYEMGWGYNKQTGPDADSTANVVLFFKSIDRKIPEADQTFLLAHQQQDGGFSTYLDNKGWCISHPDVTPMVFMALSDSNKRSCASSVARYVEQQCTDEFLWPAYWWRNCFYSCYHNYKLITQLLGGDREMPSKSFDQVVQVSLEEPFKVEAAFDLAWLCGLYWLRVQHKPSDATAKALAMALTQELIDYQGNDGCWLGSASLRVTDPETFGLNMAVTPNGKYYSDHYHTITTASVLQVLAVAKTCLDV